MAGESAVGGAEGYKLFSYIQPIITIPYCNGKIKTLTAKTSNIQAQVWLSHIILPTKPAPEA